ncbi:MAG TPA: hypothetical protein VHD56_09785 [Tepidisphaeraceae bacterium]|nr:hypothetical protein [Tepidisphaeraceae bacterium]
MKNILELLKKNLVSIICGIVAIAAVVVYYSVITGKYQQLQAEATSHSADFSAMNSLLTKERHLPQLALEETEAKKLDRFPTQPVIDWGTNLINQFKAEKDAVYTAAVKLVPRQLLVPNSLPTGGTDMALTFRDQYKATMNLAQIDTRANSYLIKLMNGVFLPSTQQTDARKQEVERAIRANAIPSPTGGPALNAAEIEAEIGRTLPHIPDDMRREAAEKNQVYVDPTAFEMLQSLVPNNTTPETWQIFSAQMGLWLHEDIINSIAAANKNSKNVMDSPVKHLIKIRVPQDMFRPYSAAALASVTPANVDPGQPITKTYGSFNSTGRTTNGLYDCIRIQLVVYADAEQVPLVLQELSRGKYITVTNCSVTAVDPAFRKTQGYYYGDKPVVELVIDCEDLVMRESTTPYMPPATRASLGIPSPQPAAK